MKKDKSEVHSGLNPPKEGAKPRGEVHRSTDQDQQYRQVITTLKEKENSGKKYQLQLCHVRGKCARKLLKEVQTFGNNTIDAIAADLGIKRLSLQQCMRFSKRISPEQLNELSSMSTPPSWRMMAKWVGIKDSEKRENVLKDILAGKLGSDGFEEQIRSILGSGPKKPRRPASLPATFKRIAAEATTMVQHLDWVGPASEGLQKIDDPIARREIRVIVQDSLEKMRVAVARLNAAITECEQLI